MAHKIAQFPTASRRSKYDVDTWFDGNIWKLIQGEDFNVPIASFRGSLYNQANKKGFAIRTSVDTKDGVTALIVAKTGNKPQAENASAKKPAKAKAKSAA